MRATPGEIRTFRDWVVGCDNGRACRAVALGTDGGEFPQLVVAVSRRAGPTGAVAIQLSGEADFAGRVTLLVDGRPVAVGNAVSGEVSITGPAAANASRALAQGTEVAARSGARRWGTASLAGAAAALRYMDGAQGRAGTTTALVARGAAAPSRVPRPTLPVILRAAASGAPARLSPALIADMSAQAECNDRAREINPSLSAHPLDRGRTVVLFPCQLGAYNSVEAIFIVEGGRARAATFDSDVARSDNDRVPVLINSGYGDGVLGGFGKGRGLGDCGLGEDHVWDGTRFRLVHRREMPECRGTRELITTWLAVVR